jgi:hypothetical protein
MLAQEHAAKLREAGGRVIEGTEDAFPVLDRQRKDQNLGIESTLEHGRGGLVDELRQLADEVGADRNPRRGPANEFAVGSAKTSVAIIVNAEHASFSAHNTGTSCEATGHIVYKNFFQGEFSAKITKLVIDGNAAFFSGPITKVTSGSFVVGDIAYFSASDSGMPGGTGDTFMFDFAFFLDLGCLTPSPGHVITSGNVVIKTTGP